MKDILSGSVTPEQAALFEKYYNILIQCNKEKNLTAIINKNEAARLHFFDCLALLEYSNFVGKSLIDIGSGAGFPGVPMKIACPELSLTLLDSSGKRTEFLRGLCHELEIDSEIICGRAEEVSLCSPFRDGFDFAVSRAVARLDMLCELCIPFVKPGGFFLAMKSSGCDEEKAMAENAVKLLGGKLLPDFVYSIPGTDIKRRLIVINKASTTPKGYPRRYARIKSTPL